MRRSGMNAGEGNARNIHTRVVYINLYTRLSVLGVVNRR